MTDNNRNSRSMTVATLAAGVLVLILGLAYRALAAWLGVPVRTAIPVARDALERLPLQIGGWAGQDVPLDEAIIRKTGSDAHVNRRYCRRDAAESVSLYVACGVRVRYLIDHRPEICYIGSGWVLSDQQSLELPLADGGKLPCTIFKFSRGVLETEKVAVLSYFLVEGRPYGHASDVVSTMGYRLAGVNQITQVQIVSTTALAADRATESVSAFAVDSAASIAALSECITHSRSGGAHPALHREDAP
jgi:hypothetical protein